MPKRSSKPPCDEDEVQSAVRIIATVTDEDPNTSARIVKQPKKPIPKAVSKAAAALGRLGGLKGGKARASKLSAKRRSEIAKKAAKARWKSQQPD